MDFRCLRDINDCTELDKLRAEKLATIEVWHTLPLYDDMFPVLAETIKSLAKRIAILEKQT